MFRIISKVEEQHWFNGPFELSWCCRSDSSCTRARNNTGTYFAEKASAPNFFVYETCSKKASGLWLSLATDELFAVEVHEIRFYNVCSRYKSTGHFVEMKLSQQVTTPT